MQKQTRCWVSKFLHERALAKKGYKVKDQYLNEDNEKTFIQQLSYPWIYQGYGDYLSHLKPKKEKDMEDTQDKEIRHVALIAQNDKGIIGVNNTLPWHIPEDLKWFKQVTQGHVVVMGKNTFLSLPEKVRPLPNRDNVVISSSLPVSKGIILHRHLSPNLPLLLQTYFDKKTIFWIGGASIYNEMKTMFDKIVITHIPLALTDKVKEGDKVIKSPFTSKMDMFDNGYIEVPPEPEDLLSRNIKRTVYIKKGKVL